MNRHLSIIFDTLIQSLLSEDVGDNIFSNLMQNFFMKKLFA